MRAIAHHMGEPKLILRTHLRGQEPRTSVTVGQVGALWQVASSALVSHLSRIGMDTRGAVEGLRAAVREGRAYVVPGMSITFMAMPAERQMMLG